MYFRFPFAVDGTKATVPQTTQPDGSVSYQEGWGNDYQLEPGVDPDAKDIPRAPFNEIMYQVTLALQQYQQYGFPEWIAAADNGGVAFEYAVSAWVRYGGATYYSLVASNTATPGTDPTKWQLFPVAAAASFQTADVVQSFDSTLPSGWLWVDGKTIGNASSGGTARANADTSALFTALWNSMANSVLPIQDSAGVASTRGISAAADYAANKRLPLPDMRGRVAVGKDNLGGTAASRVTTAGCDIDGATLGANGGAQNVALTEAQLAAHTHTGTASSGGSHTHDALVLPVNNGTGSSTGIYTFDDGPVFRSENYDNLTFPGDHIAGKPPDSTTGPASAAASGSAHSHTLSLANTGSGTAHQNMQPTIMALFRIKL